MSRVLEDALGLQLDSRVREILQRRPAVGLALAVVRDGRLAYFHGHGLADIASGAPISQDTVFRIGSISKLFTAVAVMQLAERGLIVLDAPANDYLRAYKLVPAEPAFRAATIRQLLTHTAGVPEVRGLGDLLRADVTPSGGRSAMPTVRAGEQRSSLAAFYRDGLRVVVEPGTAFAYSNHGFATLGQIVEDVTGKPLDGYMRDCIFEPLGMANTGLVRSEPFGDHVATGYVIGRRGARPVPDREEIGGGGGGIYSTPLDMVRFTASLMSGGANEHGRVLEQSTLATMFEPHFQADRRMPGMGLSFFRGYVGEHRIVGHDGILPGFNSALAVAPDDRVGLIAFTNGSSGAFAWLPVELHRLMGQLLGVTSDPRHDIPHRPEVWADLCGRYVFPPRISDLRGRLMLGGGVEVFVGGGRLMARVLTPIPALLRGLPLSPGDDQDPDVFRLDLSDAGMAPVRVVFARDGDGIATAVHTDLGGQPWSLIRRSSATRQRWLGRALGALALGGAVAAGRRWASRRTGART